MAAQPHKDAAPNAGEETPELGELRAGVERAVQALGQGLLAHPKNDALRAALRGGLSPAGFHGELLRVVYRLIFLFIAEDRALDGVAFLHPRDDTDVGREARGRYLKEASATRLRMLASEGGDARGDDLWHGFHALTGALAGDRRFDDARRRHALPVLGGVLWSPGSTPHVNAPNLIVPERADQTGSELADADFLEVVRHLAFTRRGGALREVAYTHLGSKDLGGVYEHMLALTPRIGDGGAGFTFAELGGNQRKASGSFYTPDALVQHLLDSALDPVVAEAVAGKSGVDAESAILGLRICDPACGSGHFLVGAAHRLASHLARARAGEAGEPSPAMHQHALREVIRRCIFGVDINPMAVELCKVSLWMESMEPGKPLTFLDAHIKCGNALLGATPVLLEAGIPDGAFEPLAGDDASATAAYKKRNRRERKDRAGGQGMLLELPGHRDEGALGDMPAILHTIMDEPEDDTDAVRRHEERYSAAVHGDAFAHAKLVADAWCAAFVWRKQDADSAAAGERGAVTERVYREIERDPRSARPWIKDEIQRLAAEHRFFHWHLEFPDVFERRGTAQSAHSRANDASGFCVILGNPPFLNQLETATSTARGVARIIEALSGGVIRGYTDVSAAFLLHATQITRNGGRIALVQPQSLLAVKDGAPVRSAVLKAGALEALWVSNEHVFEGVSVYTCAPTIHIGGKRRSTIVRSTGAAFRPLPSIPLDNDALAREETWAHLGAAAAGIPEITLSGTGTLGSIAEATADFRDQYYGLDGFLIDDADVPAAQRADFSAFPPIVTTGLIDLAACRWGESSTRILKKKWAAPRIDRARMESSGALGPWIRARLVPKVLLATQTRIIEVFVDPTGRCVPSIPLITVTAKRPERLWHIAAAIASPVCSALAMQKYAGAAMSTDAIKLSARQVLAMPLPADEACWSDGAGALEAAHNAATDAERRRQLGCFGVLMCRAYELSESDTEALMVWWSARLGLDATESDHANRRRPGSAQTPRRCRTDRAPSLAIPAL